MWKPIPTQTKTVLASPLSPIKHGISHTAFTEFSDYVLKSLHNKYTLTLELSGKQQEAAESCILPCMCSVFLIYIGFSSKMFYTMQVLDQLKV